MSIILRPGRPADAAICGNICYHAFKAIADQHDFPLDISSEQIAIGLMTRVLSMPGVYVVVAEQDGRIFGSNVLFEMDPIAGIGPITIDPAAQNASIGRTLMEHVLDRVRERKCPGVRLVQAAFHNRSLSLYTKLGFDVREPLACLNGPPIGKKIDGHPVRVATEADWPACNDVCLRVHGHARANELLGAICEKSATVVVHDGRITGYATLVGFFGHAVAETNEDLKALIAAAPGIAGAGFLLPSRNGDVFRWCLANGLRVVQPMTLMTMGLYNEPAGAFLSSILF